MDQEQIFSAIKQGLHQTGSVQTPPEAHGTLTGRLCIDNETPGGHAVEDVDSEMLDQALDALREITLNGLFDPELSFTPLLPGDDVDLDTRVQALANWCAGFLYGLSVTGNFNPDNLTAESRELVDDLTELSRADLTSEDDETGTAEADYMELVEYVRVAAQTLFLEFRPAREGPKSRQTLH
ncbi:UPF0149 family protein [Salinisphaera sp. USBA-960]|uniref:UPF0149 family protein n=1 Tax=Salinisphaera orenii TaxID=856731 RepID=UPI000DBE162A|nr:UPF0149 family protein [Salifodinibacter halophilus]NNC26460.1 UPF0149 family protein [Salifodinibacter halophilus]